MDVTSAIASIGPAQEDGRFYVKEIHTAGNGRTIDREYLCAADMDPWTVLEEARLQIQIRLQKQEEARLAVVGLDVPLTKHAFLNLFSSAERKLVRVRAQTDENVLDFMEMLNASGGVYKTFAWEGLMYLAHIEVLSWERAEAISEAMNG